jgi:hypothetical protein
MAQPFECCCGTKECLGTIQGAAHLSNEVLSKYTLTEFIQQKIKSR